MLAALRADASTRGRVRDRFPLPVTGTRVRFPDPRRHVGRHLEEQEVQGRRRAVHDRHHGDRRQHDHGRRQRGGLRLRAASGARRARQGHGLDRRRRRTRHLLDDHAHLRRHEAEAQRHREQLPRHLDREGPGEQGVHQVQGEERHARPGPGAVGHPRDAPALIARLAWRNARRRPGRLAALVLGIAAPVALVFVLGGLYLGLLEGNVSYLRTLDADVVVSEEGAPLVTTLLQSSRIPGNLVRKVRGVPGVHAVDPLYGRLVTLEQGPTFTLVYLVGRSWGDDFAGPVTMRAGRRRVHIGEIVVDRVLASDLGVGIGGTVRIGAAELRVVGIADGGNAVLGSYAFVHHGALVLAGVRDPAYLLVRAEPGVDVDALARAIDALPGVRAVTRTRFLTEKQAPFRQMLLPVIVLVVALAAAVGGAIVGGVLLAATLERHREHATLRVVGCSARDLRALVLLEAAIATGLGVALGLASGRIVAAVFGLYEPRFLTVLPPGLAGAIATAAAVIASVAALVPLRALARVRPVPFP